METIKNRLKTIALFLTGLILFQSCVVYHNNPSSLEQASREHIKTKVTGTNGETSRYKYIAFEEGQFYGVNNNSGERVKTPLDQKDLAKVLTKDKSTSTFLTVVLSLVGFYIIGIIIYALE